MFAQTLFLPERFLCEVLDPGSSHPFFVSAIPFMSFSSILPAFSRGGLQCFDALAFSVDSEKGLRFHGDYNDCRVSTETGQFLAGATRKTTAQVDQSIHQTPFESWR